MFRWIQNWLFSDRIRCTPGHSRLFRMEVGDRVLVRDQLWNVSKRTDQASESGVLVRFDLVEEGEHISENSISLVLVHEGNLKSHASVQWNGKSSPEDLFEEDVTILKS